TPRLPSSGGRASRSAPRGAVAKKLSTVGERPWSAMDGSRPCVSPSSSDRSQPTEGVVETCESEGQALGTASVSAFPGRYGKGPHVERSGNLPRRAASARATQRAPGAVLVRAQRERQPADQ